MAGAGSGVGGRRGWGERVGEVGFGEEHGGGGCGGWLGTPP
jgi:hypothetical protein